MAIISAERMIWDNPVARIFHRRLDGAVLVTPLSRLLNHKTLGKGLVGDESSCIDSSQIRVRHSQIQDAKRELEIIDTEGITIEELFEKPVEVDVRTLIAAQCDGPIETLAPPIWQNPVPNIY